MKNLLVTIAFALALVGNLSAGQTYSTNDNPVLSKTVLVTCIGGACQSPAGFVPAGSLVYGVTIRFVTNNGDNFSGALFTVGRSTDTDRYGALQCNGTTICTEGSASSGADFATDWSTAFHRTASALGDYQATNDALINMAGNTLKFTLFYQIFGPPPS